MKNNIRNLRNGLHLSKEYVASLLNIKDYDVLEKGKRNPTKEELSKLSDFYGESEDVILFGKKIEKPENVSKHQWNQLNKKDKVELLSLICIKNNIKMKTEA